jgi:hypothetical protein
MTKRKIIFYLFFVFSISFTFADTLTNGVYSLNGSVIKISFSPASEGKLSKTKGKFTISGSGEGNYRFEGSTRIALSFPVNMNLGAMSGLTYTYTIYKDDTFSNNLQTWKLIKPYTKQDVETFEALTKMIRESLLESFKSK